MEIIHTPVLLEECLSLLSPVGEPFEKTAFMVDSTLGEGGHSSAFLSRFPSLSVIGVDADRTIQERAKERLSEFGGRMQFFSGWFNDFYQNYPSSLPKPHIILFDLGISVFHYERAKRGFSFRYDEGLDMRLNPEEGGESASDIVNKMSEKALSDLIYRYGEEKLSRRIARAVVCARQSGKIESAKALADIIYDSVPSAYRFAPIHPATRTFQALRIAVNGELNRLPSALHAAFNTLEIGGKIGVITFHSLEDRIVKNYFRNLTKNCVCPQECASCRCGGSPCASAITKKPREAGEDEVRQNPPSRSAKLRVIKKICDASDFRLAGVEGF